MADGEYQWRVPEWFPDLSETQLSQLRMHFDLLTQYSKKTDIVSQRTLPFADLLHFAFSISGSRLMMEQSQIPEVTDLGGGSGFPGLVMKVLYPTIQLSIVESDPRKIEFAEHVIRSSSLEGVNIVRKSLNDIEPGALSSAIYRGAAPVGKVLLQSRKLFRVGGRIFHFKGEEWATEVSQIPSQLCVHWKPSLLGTYRLPLGEVNWAVVRTEKVRE